MTMGDHLHIVIALLVNSVANVTLSSKRVKQVLAEVKRDSPV